MAKINPTYYTRKLEKGRQGIRDAMEAIAISTATTSVLAQKGKPALTVTARQGWYACRIDDPTDLRPTHPSIQSSAYQYQPYHLARLANLHHPPAQASRTWLRISKGWRRAWPPPSATTRSS